MAVKTNSTSCDGGVVVFVNGTPNEVMTELTTATSVKEAFKIQKLGDVVPLGVSGNSVYVMYVHKN